jgi:saccharopine dehydrogenase (NAD+, L-lysine-forming)
MQTGSGSSSALKGDHIRSVIKIWIRNETKINEKRTPLSPSDCKILINNYNFIINVEKSMHRIYINDEYNNAGCNIVDSNSWINAPLDYYILGIKELDLDNVLALKHKHIYFGHCYKNQVGWKELLQKFINGNGLLLDLEYLTDDNNKRLTAFGHYAGFAGAFIGFTIWCNRKMNTPLINYDKSFNKNEMIELSMECVEFIKKQSISFIQPIPSIIIIGAYGRCGKGITEFFENIGIDTVKIGKYDKPFDKKCVLNYDILFNAIYLKNQIDPFITKNDVDKNKNLSLIVDISCDIGNQFNPLPLCEINTTFQNPTHIISNNPLLEIVTIDNLPTLMPRESSDDFSKQLMLQLIKLNDDDSYWKNTKKIFYEKIKLI